MSEHARPASWLPDTKVPGENLVVILAGIEITSGQATLPYLRGGEGAGKVNLSAGRLLVTDWCKTGVSFGARRPTTTVLSLTGAPPYTRWLVLKLMDSFNFSFSQRRKRKNGRDPSRG